MIGSRDKNILFEQVYDNYFDDIYKYIYINVEDKQTTHSIIENVFTKVYKRRNKIDDIEKSKKWIFRIAYDEVINFCKSNDKKMVNEFKAV